MSSVFLLLKEVIALKLILEILIVIALIVGYKLLMKRYNIKKRPYMIDDLAVKIINDSDVAAQSAALRTVYKKKKNYKLVAKFNRALAREIYLKKLEDKKYNESEIKEK